MTNKDDNERGIARYSSSQMNRGLELAKKVSVATVKTDLPQKINIEQIDSNKYTQDAEYFLKVAMQQITPTEYQYALANIQKAIDINPDYYEAYIVRYSMIYLPLGCYQEAIDDCNQILQINPKNAEALNNRGWAYAQLGYQLQALQDYDLAILIMPDMEIAYLNRGLSYVHCNNFHKAINDFQYIISINPRNAHAHNNKGLCLMYLNQHIKAIDEFNQAIKINPELANAYLNKGTCYINLGDEEQVTDNFAIGFTLDNEYSKDYFKEFDEDEIKSIALMFVNSGLSLQEESNYKKAIDILNLAIYLNPVCQEAYYVRGTVKFQLSYFQEAIDDFNKVLSMNAQHIDSYISIGTILNQNEQHQDAIDCYDSALKIDPYCELALTKRGVSRLRIGDKQGALNDYTKVVKINKNNSLAYILRAKIYHEANYINEANEDYIKGSMLLGNQYLESGEYQEAIEHYNEILELEPYYADAYQKRSKALMAIGNSQKAREDLSNHTKIMTRKLDKSWMYSICQ
jgi:tetratricopeptide (TPR) repeat protein